MKPHGRDCPARCSQCLGVTPRRVSSDATTIDGQPSGRGLDGEAVRRHRFGHRDRGYDHGGN